MSVPVPACSAPRTALPAGSATGWWLPRETTLNWLALGLLLSAWNAVDDGAPLRQRPDGLRGYPAVSVRALQRAPVSP